MTGSSVLQADSNSTTLMSGTFNVERRIHRKLRLHPDGERARCLPGDQTGLASLGSLSVGAARRPWPTLIGRQDQMAGNSASCAGAPAYRFLCQPLSAFPTRRSCSTPSRSRTRTRSFTGDGPATPRSLTALASIAKSYGVAISMISRL